MGIFVQDSFTGAAGSLTAHTGEIGGWLADLSGWPNNDPNGGRLNGSGSLYALSSGTTVRTASSLSDVVAPQLDCYVELHINVGVLPSSGSSSIKLFAHHQPNLPSGTSYSDTSSIFFDTTSTTVYAPNYGPPDPYQTDLAAVANNSNHIIRVEYRYGAENIKFFFDGAMVVEWVAPLFALPTVPGNFAFDMDSYSAPSGSGITVDYLEIGTIDPPSPFWTDFVGNISEVP